MFVYMYIDICHKFLIIDSLFIYETKAGITLNYV